MKRNGKSHPPMVVEHDIYPWYCNSKGYKFVPHFVEGQIHPRNVVVIKNFSLNNEFGFMVYFVFSSYFGMYLVFTLFINVIMFSILLYSFSCSRPWPPRSKSILSEKVGFVMAIHVQPSLAHIFPLQNAS